MLNSKKNIELSNIINSEWDVGRRDKADQLRNLVENFSNMSLMDYLEGVVYFFEIELSSLRISM
jgi:hypothetical protein